MTTLTLPLQPHTDFRARLHTIGLGLGGRGAMGLGLRRSRARAAAAAAINTIVTALNAGTPAAWAKMLKIVETMPK
jgi:hypothetical protein